MSSTQVKGVKRHNSGNTGNNAILFAIEQMLFDTVNTAEMVRVDEAEQGGTGGPAGCASATPLVCQTDGYHKTLASASIPRLPFYRPQAGKAAIVMDPQPGDKAVAVFMKRDSSRVQSDTKEPVQPGSFRSFDLADGCLFNGFLGEEPEIWLHLNPASGDISLSTKAAKVEISCRESGDIDIRTGSGKVSITATERVSVRCPDIVLDGNVRVTGSHTVDGKSYGRGGGAAVFSRGLINESGGFANAGGISNSGGLQNTGGSLSSNGVTLETHCHRGVEPGGGESGAPSQGE